MRRKKKLGVRSNHTIKQTPNTQYCSSCKGICKSNFEKFCDESTNWHQYNEPSKKLWQYGFGSLMPGKKFVIYDRMHVLSYRYLRDQIAKRKQDHKWLLKDLAKEERSYYNFFKE